MDGNVVGIVTARLSDVHTLAATGTLPQNVNYALKSSFVLPFLEAVPQVMGEMKTSPAVSAANRSAIIDRAKIAVSLVLCY